MGKNEKVLEKNVSKSDKNDRVIAPVEFRKIRLIWLVILPLGGILSLESVSYQEILNKFS